MQVLQRMGYLDTDRTVTMKGRGERLPVFLLHLSRVLTAPVAMQGRGERLRCDCPLFPRSCRSSFHS